MISLKELIETKIIRPEEALMEDNITLYHGTNYITALKAKKTGIGPIDKKKIITYILMMHFDESETDANRIFDQYFNKSLRVDQPNALFLTTNKNSAINYATFNAKWGGELMFDILSKYIKDKKVPDDIVRSYHEYIDKPALITLNVPLSLVFTHPHWKTPLKDILKRSRLHRRREIYTDWDKYPLDFGEVYVYEHIPAKYVQRIDRIYKDNV
jgi:hypothetical protein